MNRAPFVVVVGGAAEALALSVCPNAHAIGPVDVEVGVIAGGGTTPTSRGDAAYAGGWMGLRAPNTLGFGLGGRAGVGLEGFYAGVEGMYYFGSSTGAPYNVSTNSDLFGVDVGYSIKLPVVTIRPLIGVGSFTERADGLPVPVGAPSGYPATPVSSSQSYSTIYVQPGITVLVPLGKLFVGADANVLWLQSLPETIGGSSGDHAYLALTIHAQVGARF